MLNRNSRLCIVVMGYVVRGPLGGMAWMTLQYLRGFTELGHEVYYLEDSHDYPSCYDPIRYCTIVILPTGLSLLGRPLSGWV